MNLITELNSGLDIKEHAVLEKFDKVIQDSEFIRKILCSSDFIEKQQSKEIWSKMIFNSSFFIKTMGADFFFTHFIESYSDYVKQEVETLNEWEQTEVPPKIHIIEDLHKVVQNLGPAEWFKNNFDKQICSLMADKYLPAQGKILENLYKIYEILDVEEETEEMKEIGFDKSKMISNIMKSFIKMEETISSNWRYLNLWIDCAFQIVLRLHKAEPNYPSKIDGTSATLK